MAIEVWESVKSRASNRSRDASTRTMKWIARGAPDEVSAENAVLVEVPLLYWGLPLQSVAADEVLAGDLYMVEVTYTNPKRNRELGLVAIEFDTTGGKAKITNSLETVRMWSDVPEELAPDFHGAINVNEKRVEGVEIVIPALKFSLVGVVPFDFITVAYARLSASLTGSTNDSPFLDFDMGELLYLGAVANTRKDSEQQPGVEVKWSFEASQNVAEIPVGRMVVTDKAGHDYLWVLHKPEEDFAAKYLPLVPKAVYVERVYGPSDFYALNIPTE